MSPNSSRQTPAAVDQYKASLSLGHLLKRRREELELSLERVERDTKIRHKYLEYIETGNYERLRDDIYSRGYVKNYADYLGLETAPILLLYKKERSMRADNLKTRGSKTNRKIGLTPIHNPRWIVTPRTFVALSIISILVLVLGYLAWQFAGLAAAPHLTLDNPSEETVTNSVAFISGHVDGGADVFVNDSPILTNGEGAFREQIALVSGVNQIHVSAKNKLGKVAALTKTYIANLPKDTTQAVVNGQAGQTQTQKFDGVQLTVRTVNNASWLIVTADNVEIYRGTMLAGSTQTFQAAGSLKVSVGNAGAVDVILTNNQVAQKDLGTLGRDGEIKRDIEFKKDTNTL